MRIVAYIFISLLFLFSCKKDAKWQVYVTVSAKMAHNSTPIAGVKWKIIESKGKGGIISWQNSPTDWELEGETNSAGLAIANFYPKKYLDYQYDIVFDYSSMNVPAGDYEVVNGPSPFAKIVREHENIYDIKMLPYMDVDYHYQNINCFNANDSLRFKSYNASEKPNLSQGQIEGLNWNTGSFNQGCANWTYAGNTLAGRHIYIWEATRNNITTTGVDTFHIEPGGNNLIEFFW